MPGCSDAGGEAATDRLIGLRRRGRASGRKVVLLDLTWTRGKDPRIPLGQASLVAALREAGVSVEPWAVAVNAVALDVEALADEVVARSAGSPDEVDLAIGAYVWGEEVLRRLLPAVRARGFAGRIILGGPQVSYAPAGLEALYPEATTFVRGHGEAALVALVREGGRPAIEGVHHAGDADRAQVTRVDLARLPSPWLTGVLAAPHRGFVRWETQRGCPFRCTFCQHREAGRPRKVRELALGEARIEAEIAHFCRAGVGEIAVLDPIFNLGERAVAVLERFAAGGFGGRLELQCRAELLDDDFLAAAARLDVCVELGLQTVVPAEWKVIERNNDLAKVERGLAGLRRRGIDHEVSLIFGLPGQTLESFIGTVGWCLAHEIPTIKAFPLMLLRGTQLERDRSQWALEDDGTAMARVTSSSSFGRASWQQMAAISEALRVTEGRHPSLATLLAMARELEADPDRWQPARIVGGAS